MPQLDATTFLSQIFWLFLSFSILYAFIAYYVTPIMTALLDERELKMSGNIRKVEKLKFEAEKFKTEYNSKLKHALKNASLNISEETKKIRKDLEAQKAKKLIESDKVFSELDKRLNKFKKDSSEDMISSSIKSVKSILREFGNFDITDKKIEKMILDEIRNLSVREK